jgi:putative PIN family toxin of toxin-antitoxin system
VNPLRAVLDANVYVSAYIHPQGTPGRILEHFVREAAFEVIISREISNEILRALAYPKVRKATRTSVDPQSWFAYILAFALVVPGECKMSGFSDDPDDDKYISTTIEAGAAFVVSGDPHLLSLGEREGVRMMTPRQFLELLEEGRTSTP